MKTIGYIVQKEFRQIFRNKAMLPIIFVMPILQLLILSNAATFDIKNIRLSYVDNNRTSTSRALINSFDASDYFKVLGMEPSHAKAYEAMENGTVDVILEIPKKFEQDLSLGKGTAIGVYINAIDGAKAGVENVYVNQVVQSFSKQVQLKYLSSTERAVMAANVVSVPAFWYNKELDYKTFMVPGILVLLVTMVTLFLSAMNIVREKETGTLEQINVTPIKKYQFIIGKLFPFWVLGLVLLTVGLLLAKLVFQVPMVGSVALLYLFTAVYLLLILGMGLLVSNYTDTQQQAMFIAWFFIVIFILLSGLFTPIESMPVWAQKITYLNPIRYFVEIIRMVMLKGSGFWDIARQLAVIAGYALALNVITVWGYKKTR